MDLLILAFVLSTSLILLAAGAEHLVTHPTLRSRMRMHHVLGPRGVRWASTALPVLELLAAVGTFWSVATSSRAGLVASLLLQTALFWAFAGYLVMVVRAGNAGVPCGCGPAELPVGRSATARAVGLGVVSLVSAVGLMALDLGSVTIGLDARGLLAGAAGFTLAILLVILAPARRMEALTNPDDVSRDRDQPAPGNKPALMTIGSP